MPKLSEQIVVVTGSRGALGEVVFTALEARAKQVVGTVRGTSVQMIESKTAAQISCDLTDLNSTMGLAELVVEKWGNCHSLVNVAGGFAMHGTVESTQAKDWEQQLTLNFFTALNTIRALIPAFKSTGFGRIINFGSVAGDAGLAAAGPYAASKSAVHNLTKTVALEGDGDITANLIRPGTIDTPANRAAMPNDNFSLWTPPETIASLVCDILDEDHPSPSGQVYNI
jgi:NAD(P)-dependent dehydrogenase (short-subunit alcohol dehydrogenase family)